MRSDMNKVIVERPRLLRGDWLRGGRESGFRQFLQDEERAPKIGIRAGHQNRKWFNENLAPLRRFLESSAGRPWDKVLSELRAGIDVRNTVQAHILEHVEDFVKTKVRVRELSDHRGRARGHVFEARKRWSGEWEDVRLGYAPLFVDPRTGLLRATRSRAHRTQVERAREQARAEETFAHSRTLADGRAARAFEGIWYAVETAPIPGSGLTNYQKRTMSQDQKAKLLRVYDVLKRAWISRMDADEYVTAKTQLGKKELRGLPASLRGKKA
jgi:hypothetical protein